MTDAVIDTVALVKHLEDTLPPKAATLFRSAENDRSRLYIPEVALGEFAYLCLKGRLGLRNPRAAAEEVISDIRGSGYIRAVPVGSNGWGAFLDLEIPELHDRMIAATSMELGLPLVSNDPIFRTVRGLDTVWA